MRASVYPTCTNSLNEIHAYIILFIYTLLTVIQYLGSHVLVICVCVFCDSFLCSISLLLLSGSLSYILNSVIVHEVTQHIQAICLVLLS